MHRRRVMDEPIIFVGLDVHKDTITVALAEEGRRSEVREYGRIANTPEELQKLLDKLARTGRTLRFCYEAGPCGYGIQRQVTAAGHECVVVAPSLIPRKPGERIKSFGSTPSALPRLKGSRMCSCCLICFAPRRGKGGGEDEVG